MTPQSFLFYCSETKLWLTFQPDSSLYFVWYLSLRMTLQCATVGEALYPKSLPVAQAHWCVWVKLHLPKGLSSNVKWICHRFCGRARFEQWDFPVSIHPSRDDAILKFSHTSLRPGALQVQICLSNKYRSFFSVEEPRTPEWPQKSKAFVCAATDRWSSIHFSCTAQMVLDCINDIFTLFLLTRRWYVSRCFLTGNEAYFLTKTRII